MGKKRQQNDFFFFMLEKKGEVERKSGRVVTMAELPALLYPEWKVIMQKIRLLRVCFAFQERVCWFGLTFCLLEWGGNWKWKVFISWFTVVQLDLLISFAIVNWSQIKIVVICMDFKCRKTCVFINYLLNGQLREIDWYLHLNLLLLYCTGRMIVKCLEWNEIT